MRRILIASLVLFSSIFIIFFSCEKNNISPILYNNFLQNPDKILQRSFQYDEKILLQHSVDLDDFKNTYSYQEMLNIIVKSNDKSEMTKHKSIIVDDDLIYVNIYALVYSSFEIIEGKVLKVELQWDTDKISIYTYKTIKILNTFKGKILPDTVTVIDIGGSLDGYTTQAYPVIEYLEDENVFIFLQPDNENYRTYGRSQGKFTVIQNGKYN